MAQTSGKRPGYAEGREALLEAAARVVARDGFGKLTYRTVAEQAGTTHGLVSYHFGSRDKLIHETVMRARQEAIEQSWLVPESGQLQDFGSGLSRLVSEAPDDQVLQFELALESRRRAELLPEVRSLYDEYLAVTKEALASFGIEADDTLARLVFAALDGLTLQQLIYEQPERTDAAVEMLHQLLGQLTRRKRRATPRSTPA